MRRESYESAWAAMQWRLPGARPGNAWVRGDTCLAAKTTANHSWYTFASLAHTGEHMSARVSMYQHRRLVDYGEVVAMPTAY